jgi:hypothetical protein
MRDNQNFNSYFKRLKKHEINIRFYRFFGLILGDLVSEGNEVWELYIVLRKIVLLVTAPFLHPNCCILLTTLLRNTILCISHYSLVNILNHSTITCCIICGLFVKSGHLFMCGVFDASLNTEKGKRLLIRWQRG